MRSGRKLSSKNLRAPSSSSGTAATARSQTALSASLISVQSRRWLPIAVQRAATIEKDGKRRGVIVARPAVEIRPLDRLILRIGEFDRPLARRYAAGAAMPATPTTRWRRGATLDTRRHRAYCPASVATTFQLGSREEMSRAKVQTSVTSVTFSALPSITLPDRSRVAEMSLETKRMVICAVRAAQLGGGDGRTVDRNESRLGGFAAALALGDRGVEPVKDFAREQVAQLAAIALGESGDDHLVGGAGAGDEVLGVEARIGRRRWRQARPPRSIRFRQRPSSDPPAAASASTGRRRCRLGRPRRQGHDLVGRRASHRVAGRIGIIGRPLAAGALPQNAAKPQENEYCERQEDDGVNIEHVSILSASLSASGRAGR